MDFFFHEQQSIKSSHERDRIRSEAENQMKRLLLERSKLGPKNKKKRETIDYQATPVKGVMRIEPANPFLDSRTGIGFGRSEMERMQLGMMGRKQGRGGVNEGGFIDRRLLSANATRGTLPVAMNLGEYCPTALKTQVTHWN